MNQLAKRIEETFPGAFVTAAEWRGDVAVTVGVVLVNRDDHARVRHCVRTVDRYLDSEPLRRVLADGLRKRLEEDRFGRP